MIYSEVYGVYKLQMMMEKVQETHFMYFCSLFFFFTNPSKLMSFKGLVLPFFIIFISNY